MYSDRFITEMEFSLTCKIINVTYDFVVDICKENIVDNKRIKISNLSVAHLKKLILKEAKSKLSNVEDANELEIWKVEVNLIGLENKVFTYDNVTTIGTKMEVSSLKRYFDNDKKKPKDDHVHVIVVPPAAGLSQQGVSQDGVDWKNVDSIYNWIKLFKRPPKVMAPKLVSTDGANFPLQGRDETTKILMEGNGSRNGIYQRFTKRKESDRNNHPIPLLANGPGTGKSRFLQEIPTLLREQAEKYTSNNELLKMINNQMYAINVTFGNSTSASDEDVHIGETSVALRILYEHFISGTREYEEFLRMFRGKKLKIADALDIVLKDVNSDKDKDSHIKFVVLGIDELNALHNLYDKNLDRRLGPVHLIMRAVGGLNCTGGDIFYVSILAGTIQGPLEELFKESTYLYLPLPLRLLQSREVRNISEFVSERNSLGDYINSGTFRRCIGDFGGQVRALEIFYGDLLKKLKRGTNNVDYVHCMSHVKEELIERYKFKQFAGTVIPAIAHAILNIPVSKHDKADKDRKVSYIDLSSEGILNLEKVADDAFFYVRMPYIWVVILTSFNKSCESWEVMIQQNSHVLWESFESFNMKFWTLRLTLLSILKKNVTMKDLFRGAYDLNEFGFLENQVDEFKLPDESSIKHQKQEKQYPHTSQNEHQSPCTVYMNLKGAPFDLFFFINNYLFAIQVKSSNATTNQPQTLNKKMIEKEYNKTENAYKELKGKFPEIKDWMLFICINGPKTQDALDLLQPNCLVVYKANFEDFYGYTYSSRAEFSAADDKLDANTASEYELRTVDMMGEETAREICNKRRYNDDDDLHSKVSINEQTKRRIKVVKKSN